MARQKRARNPDSRVGIVKTTLWQTSSVSVAINTLLDLLAGILIDRTQTRWRKGRPYEIFKRQAAR